MRASELDWDEIPQHVMEAYLARLALAELLLDDRVDQRTKNEERDRFRQHHGLSSRTIRNYLRRYRRGGPMALLFYRQHPTPQRIADAQLQTKILQLIGELPTRSVATLRRLIGADPLLGPRIEGISDRTIYRFLAQQGLGKPERYRLAQQTSARSSYRRFEAPCSLALVQGDARDGIWLEGPDGRARKTYLFVWIDDYSRKLLYAKYYFDETLPAMEDSFRYAVLRWGIPVKVYVDNGKVFISRHFIAVLADLDVKQVRHGPYKSYCKGKVEAFNKTTLNQFQSEAARAGLRTLEELNSAFWAWVQLDYNQRVHSSTGQSPDERFRQGLPSDYRRVSDLASFNAMFLWRARRTVTKYGRIKLHGNQYPVTCRPHSTVVQIRYDPFDLTQVAIYDQHGAQLETTTTSKQVTTQAPRIPQESTKKPPEVSQDARRYFTRLREQHRQQQRRHAQTSFTTLLPQESDREPDA